MSDEEETAKALFALAKRVIVGNAEGKLDWLNRDERDLLIRALGMATGGLKDSRLM